MLQAMRNGMNSWLTRSIISALLLFALGGLVLSDAGSFFRSGVSKGSVAEIGPEELSFVEFEKLYRLSMESFPYQSLLKVPEYRYALAKEALQKEIQTRILSLAARKAGLIINDKIAAKDLREYLKPLTEEYNMFDKQALEYVLRKQGISERVLVNNIKNRAAVKLLMAAVTTPIRAPEQLVVDMYQAKNEMRSAYFTKIKLVDFKIEPPKEEVLKEFYKAQTNKWLTPEYRDISVLKITPEVILEKEFGKDAIKEEEIKELYESRITEFSEEDIKEVAIATFKKEKDAIKIKEFLDKNPNKNLQEALKANKEIVAVYLPAEPYKKSDILPEELAEPVFNFAKDKGAVDLVKSPLGWHLAFVEKTMKGKVKSFAEVKPMLRAELVAEKTSDIMFETINELEDMFAGGDTAKEAGEFLKLPVTELKNIDMEAKDKNGNEQKLDELDKIALRYGFSQKPDEYLKAEMHELEDGSFVAVSVNKIIPPKKRDFTEVQADVLKEWIKQEQEKQANQKANEIINKIKNTKLSLKDIAKEYKLNVSYMPARKMQGKFNGDKKNPLPDTFLAKIANIQKEGDVISINDMDGVIITQLENITIPELSENPTVEEKNILKSIRSNLEEKMKDEIAEQFFNAQIAEFGVKINEYSFEKKYGIEAQKQAEELY